MEGCLTAICGTCGATMRGCRCGTDGELAAPLHGGDAGAGCFNRRNICLAITLGGGAVLAGIMTGMYFWGKSEGSTSGVLPSPSPLPPTPSPLPGNASLALSFPLTGSMNAPGPGYAFAEAVAASPTPDRLFAALVSYTSPASLCLYAGDTRLGCGTAHTAFSLSARNLAALRELSVRSANMTIGGTAQLCVSGPGIDTPSDGCARFALKPVPIQWFNITGVPSQVFFSPNTTSCFMAKAGVSKPLPAGTSALVEYSLSRTDPAVPVTLSGPVEHTFAGPNKVGSVSFTVPADQVVNTLRQSCWFAPGTVNATFRPTISALPMRTGPLAILMAIAEPPPTPNCTSIDISPSVRKNVYPYTFFEPWSVKNNVPGTIRYPGKQSITTIVQDRGPTDFSLTKGCPTDPVTGQAFALKQTSKDAVCVSPRAMDATDVIGAIKPPWGALVDFGAGQFPGMRLCLTMQLGSCGPYEFGCVIMANTTADLERAARAANSMAHAFLRGSSVEPATASPEPLL